MLKWTALPAAAALVIGASAPVKHKIAAPVASKPAPPLPVFSFMGDDTETVASRASLNAAACKDSGPLRDCSDYGNPEVAGSRLKWLSLNYNNGKLYTVLAAFGSYAYPKLLAAFTEKYGEPASTEIRKWQSKGGAVFDNAVSTWRFKGGRLELESMGGDVNSGSFDFISTTNSPPAEKPKIDF